MPPLPPIWRTKSPRIVNFTIKHNATNPVKMGDRRAAWVPKNANQPPRARELIAMYCGRETLRAT